VSPPIATIQGSFDARIRFLKSSFDLGIVTQATTRKTMFHPNIVQLSKENTQATKSFAFVQQYHRFANQVVVPMLSTLPIVTKCLPQTSNVKSFENSDLDYCPQCMRQIEDVVHRSFLGSYKKRRL
jgi:hypothetical protein